MSHPRPAAEGAGAGEGGSLVPVAVAAAWITGPVMAATAGLPGSL
ncbi:MAG TPA: hypothetical protein VND54_14060 [Candidatus Saccharimonadales bacterium]|nr:hypothetical protein [Candidatus Saccharimonadales bacterium]